MNSDEHQRQEKPMNSANAAYAAYQTAEVGTLTQKGLIIKLYQGAERFLMRARLAMTNEQIDLSCESCIKAKRIFMELLSTLNFEQGGEVATRLRDLYLFIITEIVAANVNQDPERIMKVLPVIQTLRSAWEAIPEEHANTSSLTQNGGHSLNIST
jgi:flagellar protein FliS